MKLDIPFYENSGDGNQCLQVAMKIVIEYFLKKKLSLEELDKLTKRKKNHWTWTSQIVPVLYDMGLDIIFFSKTEIEPYLEGEPFIRKHFGKDADKIIEMSDMPTVVKSVENLMKYNLFHVKDVSFEEVEKHINDGHIPMVMIDKNILTGKDGLYKGHFVIITGYDNDHVYYHETGPENPEPNKKVSKEKFISAWDANGTDKDIVIVLGKR